MANSEKDRFGDKIHDLEKAREDQWAAAQDRELLEKIRKKGSEPHDAASEATRGVGLLCPRCQQPLKEKKVAGLTIRACPNDEGAWLEQDSLKRVLANAK
jgi:hypothetical protein